MTPPDGPPPHPNPRIPRLALPPGACDSHCHIYGPFDRFPLPEDRSFTPNEAPETALRHLQQRMGLSRAVIVQSQGHGFDHRPLLAALATGAGRYRGVALIRKQTTDAEIATFAAAGICGARFSFLAHLGGKPDLQVMRDSIARVRPHGWHIAIHVAGNGLVETEGFIRAIDAPVVIDHMGRTDLADGIDSQPIQALRRLLDTGRVWVKLSGSDRISRTGAPYHDAAALARGLADHAPDRVVWGSDWPHVNLHGPMPDDGDLVDLISDIAPAEALRQKLLVDNPNALFGFAGP